MILKPSSVSVAEIELRQRLTETFRRVIRKGIKFDPRLVAIDGQIVDKVPTEIDQYLMLAHRIHLESKDETQAEGLAHHVATLIMAEIRAETGHAA
jgi:hypothetical protein